MYIFVLNLSKMKYDWYKARKAEIADDENYKSKDN